MRKDKKGVPCTMVVSTHHILLDKSNKVRTSLLQQKDEIFGQSAKTSFVYCPQRLCHRGAVRRTRLGLPWHLDSTCYGYRGWDIVFETANQQMPFARLRTSGNTLNLILGCQSMSFGENQLAYYQKSHCDISFEFGLCLSDSYLLKLAWQLCQSP